MDAARDEYVDTGTPPRLDRDGVTVLVPLRGRTAEGLCHDGMRTVSPGDAEYGELLRIARQHPAQEPLPATRQPDPQTLARLAELGGKVR
ncbi:hypothetical protein [Kitasatospora sp. KL5]|uniref:hypothetical protein n=1 Tax=Kitasatospora sp. KL5 TaxID=3425125 RepID=UPI003D6FB3EB